MWPAVEPKPEPEGEENREEWPIRTRRQNKIRIVEKEEQKKSTATLWSNREARPMKRVTEKATLCVSTSPTHEGTTRWKIPPEETTREAVQRRSGEVDMSGTYRKEARIVVRYMDASKSRLERYDNDPTTIRQKVMRKLNMKPGSHVVSRAREAAPGPWAAKKWQKKREKDSVERTKNPSSRLERKPRIRRHHPTSQPVLHHHYPPQQWYPPNAATSGGTGRAQIHRHHQGSSICTLPRSPDPEILPLQPSNQPALVEMLAMVSKIVESYTKKILQASHHHRKSEPNLYTVNAASPWEKQDDKGKKAKWRFRRSRRSDYRLAQNDRKENLMRICSRKMEQSALGKLIFSNAQQGGPTPVRLFCFSIVFVGDLTRIPYVLWSRMICAKKGGNKRKSNTMLLTAIHTPPVERRRPQIARFHGPQVHTIHTQHRPQPILTLHHRLHRCHVWAIWRPGWELLPLGSNKPNPVLQITLGLPMDRLPLKPWILLPKSRFKLQGLPRLILPSTSCGYDVSRRTETWGLTGSIGLQSVPSSLPHLRKKRELAKKRDKMELWDDARREMEHWNVYGWWQGQVLLDNTTQVWRRRASMKLI